MPGAIAPATVFFDLGDTLLFNDAGVRRCYTDTLDTLQLLKARGYRLGLLSNQLAGTTRAEVLGILDPVHLSRYLEPQLITLSSEVPGNLGKPAQPIFDLALSKAQHALASERTIFVSDKPAHILAARGFGWRAILKRNGGTCLPDDGECISTLAELLEHLPPLADLAGSARDVAPNARTAS